METEQSITKSLREKTGDTSHSEKMIDLRLNKGVSNSKTIGIFSSKRKEKVLLKK